MKKIITIIISSLLFVTQVTSLFADDIEIYQGGNTGVRPNVMMLLDTSGSMNETINMAGTFYDSETIYPGPFRNDRLYFYELPESGSDAFDIKAIRDAVLRNSIHPDSFKCESKRNELFVTKGFASSKFMQWDPSIDFEVWYLFGGWKPFHGVWRTLKTSDDPARYVDCKLDFDIQHGLTANDGLPYMSHDENGQAYTNDYSKRVPNLLPAHIFRPASPAFAGRGWWGIARNIALAATETVYTGNYLNWDFATKNGVTKIPRLYFMGQILSDVVAQYPGINVGLTRFDGRLLGDISLNFGGDFFRNPIIYDPPQGGMVAIDMVPSDTNALRFENTIKSWDAWGMTPLSEAYYEAALYMRGETPKYGNRSKVFATRDSFLGIGGTYHNYPSIPAAREDNSPTGDYKSPITQSCQDNHIIIFSDGAPTEDVDANSNIQALIASQENLPNGLSKTCFGDGGCAEELAYYLSNVDQSDSLVGTQTIKTHSIFGFTEDTAANDYLRNVSQKYGQGIFEPARDEASIRNAFRKIFDSIVGSSSSFTAPAVSVNAFNRFELSDELYYSVFKPSGNLSWKGNLKRYRMAHTATDFTIFDADDNAAIDQNTGYFNSTARSIWTPIGEPDGREVTNGGIANRLPPSRNIYTSPIDPTAIGASLRPLNITTASKNELDISNKDATYHQGLIDWAVDSDKASIEDPLHSEPTIITYEDSSKNTHRALFVGTNSGFLHAFDIDKNNPSEHFAFIPKELLANLNQYYTGGGVNAKKIYGVDGPITHYHNDINKDGKVNGNEKVYLYVALRRGGQSLYALDVTDLSAPKMLWQKHGDYPVGAINKPSVSTDYDNLGQTWGRLEPALVNYAGSPKLVLFTPGGYDPVEDGSAALGTASSGPLSRINHSQGTTVYMIDALSGNILWDAKEHTSVGFQMNSSFPANVAPLDTDEDGLADLLYAADVGGKIWRFDFSAKTNNFINDSSGAIVANLNGGPNADNRRIYNEIDVIGSADADSTLFLSVGTGNRSHPNTQHVNNYQYIIKDSVKPKQNSAILTHADLSQWSGISTINSAHGWYIPLERSGEKALSRSNTVANQIIFSTFAPKPAVQGSCDTSPGYAKSYRLDLTKGVLSTATMKNGGIPPMPMLLPPPSGIECSTDCRPPLPPATYSVLVGTEVVKFDKPIVGADINLNQLYWLEKPNENRP